MKLACSRPRARSQVLPRPHDASINFISRINWNYSPSAAKISNLEAEVKGLLAAKEEGERGEEGQRREGEVEEGVLALPDPLNSSMLDQSMEIGVGEGGEEGGVVLVAERESLA